MMIIEWLIILGLVLLSALFSGSEIAYSSLLPTRIQAVDKAKNKKAQKAYDIYYNYENALLTILIGNNLVNIAASSIATVIGIAFLGAKGAPISATIMTIIILIFGEIVPKIFASDNPLSFSISVAPFIATCMRIFYLPIKLIKPIVNLFNRRFPGEIQEKTDEKLFNEELNYLIETVESQGVMEEDDIDLLYSVMDFSEVPVIDVFTPRVDVYALDLDEDPALLKHMISQSVYSRLPVYDRTIDKIIGILPLNRYYKKSLDKPDIAIEKVIIKPIYVYKAMRLPEVLSTFQSHNSHMAIVTDEFGGTMGIVTLEDVMEYIVGDIWDENDVIENDIIQLEEEIFSIDGDLSLAEFADWLDWQKEDFDSMAITVGGWCLELLGAYPKLGDQFCFQTIDVIITKIDNLRIERIKVMIKKEKDN